MKNTKVASKQLQKYVDEHYGEAQDDFGFFPDTQDEKGYSWNFELHGKKAKLTYLFKEKRVVAA